MGIDGIGKGGAPPAGIETGGVEKKGQVKEAFSLERPDDAKPTAEAAGASDVAQAGSPLARLRAGEIDLDGYIDLKLESATQGLSGLSSAELADVREIVREQLVTDPGLADLVHRATGHIPKPPEE